MDNVYRKNRKAISELMKIIEKSKDQIPFEVYQDFDKILKEAYSYCVIQSIKADGKEVACHVKKRYGSLENFDFAKEINNIRLFIDGALKSPDTPNKQRLVYKIIQKRIS